MNLRSALSAANGYLLLGLCLIGCERARSGAQPSATSAALPPATTQSTTAKQGLNPIDRLYLAGIKDPQEARRFLERLKRVVATDDRAGLVALVRYPFKTYRAGKLERRYTGSAELITDFNSVFTTDVLRAIRDSKFDDVFVNWQGAMVGHGEVWFSRADDGIKIKAVNPAIRDDR